MRVEELDSRQAEYRVKTLACQSKIHHGFALGVRRGLGIEGIQWGGFSRHFTGGVSFFMGSFDFFTIRISSLNFAASPTSLLHRDSLFGRR